MKTKLIFSLLIVASTTIVGADKKPLTKEGSAIVFDSAIKKQVTNLSIGDARISDLDELRGLNNLKHFNASRGYLHGVLNSKDTILRNYVVH